MKSDFSHWVGLKLWFADIGCKRPLVRYGGDGSPGEHGLPRLWQGRDRCPVEPATPDGGLREAAPRGSVDQALVHPAVFVEPQVGVNLLLQFRGEFHVDHGLRVAGLIVIQTDVLMQCPGCHGECQAP